VRSASAAALRLSAWAYAGLLRAYPASFRAEFGGEMALLFSECCRDEWRSAGPAGVFRLLARVALDTLVSAPRLWAERVEEAMMGNSSDRRWALWLADHGLPLGGLVLLAVGGAATSWWAMSLGWAAVLIAFFAWVAQADGVALPRLGRVAIQRWSGLEPPLAFAVRRGERVLFFVREEDPERKGWSDIYTVRDRPTGTYGFEPGYTYPHATFVGWSLRGRVPVDDLRFENHERSTYVTRGSLDRSLSAAGV
jgi:hypothetical protein